GLAAPRNLHPSRDARQTPKLHVQLQQLRDSGLPSEIKTYRRLVRVLPEAFERLVEVLSPHQVFSRRDPRRAQATVAEKLAVTLYWLGRSGNGGGTEDVALACGCAEGSVHLYILRVVEVLYDARSADLCWASEEEKADARTWVEQRSECAKWARGWWMADGGRITLAFRRSKQAHPREYFDRKGR
ncbi:hypothetical protein V8E36_007368, partial [Tilletia maclaganii]